MATKKYSSKNFIRSGGGVAWETREAQPSDFTSIPTDESYAKKYANSPSTFFMDYPNWQAYADYYIMRRAVYNISGTQKCDTESFKASQIDDFTAADKVSVNNFRVPGGFQGSSIPSGKWLNDGMNWQDHCNGFTTVTVNYSQAGEWKLVKIQDGTPPSPSLEVV